MSSGAPYRTKVLGSYELPATKLREPPATAREGVASLWALLTAGLTAPTHHG